MIFYHWSESLLGDRIYSINYARNVTKEREQQANPEFNLHQKQKKDEQTAYKSEMEMKRGDGRIPRSRT